MQMNHIRALKQRLALYHTLGILTGLPDMPEMSGQNYWSKQIQHGTFIMTSPDRLSGLLVIFKIGAIAVFERQTVFPPHGILKWPKLFWQPCSCQK